ncbi:Uncharacterized protein dnm_049130 [Desulfonema magnum]|uniref:Uncharacterized protein n=1 Tax=Desulfonema magnum TaxID=45655 RepID=A0A975BNS2_9BACT|nr:Uncharacterized protein dnm_049130 [Desulfonema magnum]
MGSNLLNLPGLENPSRTINFVIPACEGMTSSFSKHTPKFKNYNLKQYKENIEDIYIIQVNADAF